MLDKCHRTPYWEIDVGLGDVGDGLVLSGKKSFPEPVLNQIYVTIYYH